MLKKQTVWLLTMLSLMIVLSVYYIMSDPDDYAFNPGGDDQADSETAAPGNDSKDEQTDTEEADVDHISETGKNEMFTMLRMEIQNERSMKKDRMKDIVTSSTSSMDEKNEALNNMDALDETSRKETVLEQLIGAEAEYKDVLVRSEQDKVNVHVTGASLSREEVVNIMKIVEDEFGDITVKVKQEATEG